MSPITGTSNGQDYQREAALRIASGGAAPGAQAPQMGAGAVPSGRSVAEHLQEAVTATIRDRAGFAENMAAWKQALLFLGQNMPQGQQPPQPAAGGAPSGPSPMMGEMGAQAAPGMYGRPPR